MEFYSNRSKTVLELATPTPMMDILVDYIEEAHQSLAAKANNEIPTVILNTYPYDLCESEQINLIELLCGLLTKRANVEVVRLSNQELTPKYVLENVSTLIKYDTLDWLEYHNSIGELPKCPLIDVTCVAPLISNGTKSTKELRQEDFETLRATLAHMANLVLLQSRIFSTV